MAEAGTTVDPKQSVQGRSNTARNEAMRRLVAAHTEEYETYLLEERKKRGLFGLPGAKAATMRAQLDSAQETIERMRQIMAERGIEFDDNGMPATESV